MMARALRVAIIALGMIMLQPVLAAGEVQNLIDKANEAVKKKDPKAAVIHLKNALRKDPASAQARLLLGAVYLGTGDAPAAEKELKRAGDLGAKASDWMPMYGQSLLMQGRHEQLLRDIKVTDDMARVMAANLYAMRAQAMVATGRREDALIEIDRALLKDPGNGFARVGKARILLLDNKYEKAREVLDSVIDDFPDNVSARMARADLYRVLKQPKKAIVDYTVVVEKSPGVFQALVGRGLAYLASNQPKKALQDVRAMRRKQRDAVVTHYIAAVAHFQMKRYEQAAERAERVLAKTSNNKQVELLYGLINYARKKDRLANEYLSRVHAIDTKDKEVSKLLGAVRLRMGRAHDALAVLEPIAKLHQDDAQLLAMLGNAYMQVGQTDKGAQYMTRAVELAPDVASFRTQLALGKLAGGDAKGASADLKAAVDLDQNVVQADVLLVLSLLKQGEHEKALAAAKDFEKRNPDKAIPYNLSGLTNLAMKRYKEAEASFHKALKVDPEFVTAQLNLARTRLAMKDRDGARKAYLKALEVKPKHIQAMIALARMAEQDRDAKGREEWLVKANQANVQALAPALLLAELRLRQRKPLAAAAILNALPSKTQETAAVLRVRGMVQTQAGDYSSALRSFTQLTEKAPRSVEAWFQLGRAHAAKGNLKVARKNYLRALEVDKRGRGAPVMLALGDLDLRERNFDDALKIAKAMQEKYPTAPLAHELESAAWRGKGNLKMTIAALRRALALRVSPKRANLLAHTLVASGDNKGGLAVADEYLREHPKSGVLLTTRGMILQQMGQDEGAIKAYGEALKVTPGNPVLLNNIAWLYLKQGNPKAIETAKQAYNIASERAEIVDTYGWVLFKLGEKTRGLTLLQQALIMAPKNGEIALHAAQALVGMQRVDEARPILTRVQRDHPDTGFAQQAGKLLKQLR